MAPSHSLSRALHAAWRRPTTSRRHLRSSEPHLGSLAMPSISALQLRAQRHVRGTAGAPPRRRPPRHRRRQPAPPPPPPRSTRVPQHSMPIGGQGGLALGWILREPRRRVGAGCRPSPSTSRRQRTARRIMRRSGDSGGDGRRSSTVLDAAAHARVRGRRGGTYRAAPSTSCRVLGVARASRRCSRSLSTQLLMCARSSATLLFVAALLVVLLEEGQLGAASASALYLGHIGPV